MFCAPFSSTPSEIAGGRRPSPRKPSAVSLAIIAGSASVVVAMMWLMHEGSRWTKMIRRGGAPHSSAASTKSS